MPDHHLTEEPLRFGEGGRLFGILSLPSAPLRTSPELPVFVFLTAGFTHRVGPHRLHVRLCRELVRLGFTSLRVDLTGMGDSPPRRGYTNQQSVAADFAEILAMLESRLGPSPLVLAGLCSGADNAITLALDESRVVGMVLLDPVCFPDSGLMGFRTRAIVAKYTNPASYISGLRYRFKLLNQRSETKHEDDHFVDPLALRDPPTLELMQAAFESIRKRRGRVLSVFTGTAPQYNQVGQLGRVLAVDGYQQFCTELFWRRSDHTFTLEVHRRQLVEAIKTWAGDYIAPERAPTSDGPSERAASLPVLLTDSHQA
jgi:pimeloyl-ACP methyl ester carboxylesterase